MVVTLHGATEDILGKGWREFQEQWGDEVSGKGGQNNAGLTARRHVLRSVHFGCRPRAAGT